MAIKLTMCFITIIVLSVIASARAAGETESRPVAQLPVSVLDEILKNNNNPSVSSGTDTSDQINSILAMIPVSGSEHSGDDSSNSTGIGILDFFRNLIAMFLRTFLQVFRLLQLLARSMTGIGSKKLAFLSTDQPNSDIADNQSTGFSPKPIKYL